MEAQNVLIDISKRAPHMGVALEQRLILLKLRNYLANAMICVKNYVEYLSALFRHHKQKLHRTLLLLVIANVR